MVAFDMHHGKQHNHISSSSPFTLVSGFREFGEGYRTMVAWRRAPLVNVRIVAYRCLSLLVAA